MRQIAHDFPEPTENREEGADSIVSPSSTARCGTSPTRITEPGNNTHFLIEEKPVFWPHLFTERASLLASAWMQEDHEDGHLVLCIFRQVSAM